MQFVFVFVRKASSVLSSLSCPRFPSSLVLPESALRSGAWPDGAGRMSLGVRGGCRRDTPDEWAAAAPDPVECPALGTRPVTAASLSPPACEAQARRGVPQAAPQGGVPLGTALSGEQHQDMDAARLPPTPGSDPRPPPSSPSAFPENRKRSGMCGCKNGSSSQSGQAWRCPASRLPSSVGGAQARPVWAGCPLGPLPSSFAGTPGASVLGGTQKGPRGFQAGTLLGLLRGFCALEPPPAGRSFLPGLAEAG